MDEQPPGRPTTPIRRLSRRLDHKMIAGVAAGLGDYFGIDPLLFRVGFIALVLAGGAGILLYLLMWWIVPPSPGGAEAGESALERTLRRLRESPVWVGVGLVALGIVALARGLDVRGPAVWGVVLVVGGVVLFKHAQDRGAGTIGVAGGPATWTGEAAAPSGVATGPGPRPDAPVPSFEPAPLPPPDQPRVQTDLRSRRRRERSMLGWITLGVVMVAVGMAAVLDTAGAVNLDLAQYLALALAVVGLGLVVGAWVGRARGLIVLGILILPVVLVAGLIQVPLAGGVGTQLYRPGSVQAIRSEYRLLAGDLTIDLSDVPFGLEPVHVTVSVAAGRVRVFVPEGVSLEVHAGSGAGEVDLLGRTYDGLRVHVDRTFPSSSGFGTLVLNVDSGLGQAAVFRGSRTAPWR